MRLLFILATIVIFSGCAVSPKYMMQTSTGLEVGVSKDTNKIYSLVDNNYNHVVAKAKTTNKKLIFSLPANTSPYSCYAIIDDKGKPLYKENVGFKINSIYDYNVKLNQKNIAENKYSSCINSEKKFSERLNTAEANLTANRLFNGRTCDLPPQGPIPPFPETICSSYTQCEKLANDSCTKNLIEAETCSASLFNTNVHSAITSVGCGALLSSINGQEYGISAGLQDALTGYLDQHAKNKWNSEQYGEAITTVVIRGLVTYYRREKCKEEFTKAAYAPIQRWQDKKDYIVNQPYRAQNACAELIQNFNSSLDEFNSNKSCIEDSKNQVLVLSKQIEKAKSTTSVPEACRFR